VRLLAALAFAVASGNGALFALLPELQDRNGLPTWTLGPVVAASFVAGLGAQIGLARFADRGHARRMVLGGLCAACAGALLTGTATGLPQLVLGRAATGLGAALAVTAARKLVVVLRPEAVGRALGSLLVFDIVGFVLGAPIAAAIATRSSLPVAFGVIAAGIAVLVPAVARVRFPPVPVVVRRTDERPVLRRLLGRPRLRAALLLGVATYGAIGVFDTIWARYLADLGSSPLVISATLAAFGLPLAVAAPIGGRIADRYGALRADLVGVIVSVPFMAAYGWSSSVLVLTGIAVAHCLVDGVNFPATQAAVVAECDPDEVAAGQGLLAATQQSTAAVAALVIAPVYGAYGVTVTFGGAAAVMVLAWLGALANLGVGRQRGLRG